MLIDKQQQFVALFQQHKGVAYHVINSLCDDESVKDDLFQEISLAAWLAFPNFKGESKFSTWLGRIARNRTISNLRSFHSKMKKVSINNLLYEIDTPYEEDSREIPISVISQLTSTERKTLDFVLKGLPYKEISAITGETENRLRVRMHRIKKMLSEAVRHSS